MSVPPNTTVVCENIPAGWLVGIDLQFFNTTPQFRGVKNIGDGVHILHWAVDSDHVRTGHFFRAANNTVVAVRWNASTEEMELEGDGIGALDMSAVKSRIGGYYPYMVSMPEDGREGWLELTGQITLSLLDRMPSKINSASSSSTESDMLRETLNKSAVNRGNEPHHDPVVAAAHHNNDHDNDDDEMGFTKLSRNTWREGATGSERTQMMLDKSWYLYHLVDIHHTSFDALVLGELQLSYVVAMTLANYAAAQHWVQLLEIVLGCVHDVDAHRGRYYAVLELLVVQLNTAPDEYKYTLLELDRVVKALQKFAQVERDVGDAKLRRLLEVLEIQGGGESSDDEDFAPVVVPS